LLEPVVVVALLAAVEAEVVAEEVMVDPELEEAEEAEDETEDDEADVDEATELLEDGPPVIANWIL
jgi:hypothetical protein